MVSTRPPTSKFSTPFNNPLLTIPKAPITIGKMVTSMFSSFLIPLQGRSTYPFLLLFTPLEFFTSVLADGFSLEFEWQQVSSSLQDSSLYSGRSQ